MAGQPEKGQVPKKRLGRFFFCMAVSRFDRFPIQINFAENVLAHQNPLARARDPSGPGGYMRKASGEHTQNVSASPSALYPKDINLYRVCDLEISRALSHGGTISGHSLTFEG